MNDEEFYDPNSAAEIWYYDFDESVAGFTATHGANFLPFAPSSWPTRIERNDIEFVAPVPSFALPTARCPVSGFQRWPLSESRDGR